MAPPRPPPRPPRRTAAKHRRGVHLARSRPLATAATLLAIIALALTALARVRGGEALAAGDTTRAGLRPEIEAPAILGSHPREELVLALTLSSSTLGAVELTRVAAPTITGALLAVPGVGRVAVVGGVASDGAGATAARTLAFLDGAPAVGLDVFGARGDGAPAVAQALDARVSAIRDRLPAGATLTVVHEAAGHAGPALLAVRLALLAGAPLALVALLLAFLGRGRADQVLEAGVRHRRGSIARALGHPRAANRIALGALAVAVAVAATVRTSGLMTAEAGELTVAVDAPPGSNVGYTARRAELAARAIRAHPEVRSSYTTVGGGAGGTAAASIHVRLVSDSNRTSSPRALCKRLRVELARVPGARYCVTGGGGGAAGTLPLASRSRRSFPAGCAEPC